MNTVYYFYFGLFACLNLSSSQFHGAPRSLEVEVTRKKIGAVNERIELLRTGLYLEKTALINPESLTNQNDVKQANHL